MSQNPTDYSAVLSTISQFKDFGKINRELVTAVQSIRQIDYSAFVESWKNFYASSVEPLNQYNQSIADSTASLSASLKQYNQNIAEATAVFTSAPLRHSIQNISDILTASSKDISQAVKTIQIASLIPLENQMKQFSKEIQALNEINHEIILQAVESAAPHLEDEQRRTCEEEIIPKLKNPQKEPMSRSDWFSVINILITVIFSLLSLRPDPQAQRQIEQNDQLIAISEEQLEIDKKQIDLLNQTIDLYALALNDAMQRLDQLEEKVEGLDQFAGTSDVALTDSDNHLTEDTDVFADGSKNLVDAVDSEAQDEDASGEGYDPEPQQE